MGRLFLSCIVFLFSIASLAQGQGIKDHSTKVLLESEAALADKNWEGAVSKLRKLVELNPYNGRFQYQLAGSLYRLEKYEESAAAYEASAELGYLSSRSLYNAACCYGLLTQAANSASALERAMGYKLKDLDRSFLNDSDFDSVRSSEIFQEKIRVAVSPTATREERWEVDLHFLKRRMEATHYDLHREFPREEWNIAFSTLEEEIPDLADHRIIVRLMEIVARVGDGHTQVWTPLDEHYGFHSIPIELYAFSDGLFVRSAVTEFSDLVGKRVLRIGDMSIDQALERVASVVQKDNSQQLKWLAPYQLIYTEILEALGISDRLDAVEMELVDADGRHSRETIPAWPYARVREHFGRVRVDVVDMASASELPVPLWLSRPGDFYWSKDLEDQDILYWQFNSVLNKAEGEISLTDFSNEQFEKLRSNSYRALVMDVRRNHGGENFLGDPIVRDVTRYQESGGTARIFVIIGRETFSAAQNFCNRLEALSTVIFVGEPTASRPNFVGDGNHILLPYSGLTVNASSRYWQDSTSDDYRPWIAPYLVADLSSEDYRRCHDPALTAISEYLSAKH